METVLVVSKRPCSFDKVIGQDTLIRSIRSRIEKGRMPKAWLFSGPSGGGKTTLARILAVSLQQEDYSDFGNFPPSDNPIESSSMSSYDIHEINAAQHNKIDDIAEIIEISQYAPNAGSRYKIFIWDEAHRITTQAQQLLLKPTEDATNRAVWIFCTTEPGKLNLTLKRRCARYEVSELDARGIRVLLMRVGKAAGIERLAEFYEAVKKSSILKTPGMILHALEKFASDGDLGTAFQPEGFQGDVFHMVQSMTRGNWKDVSKELGDGKMTAETARGLRALAGGYLRTMLLKAGATNKGVAISRTIDEFADTARTYDDSMLAVDVLNVLFKCTLRFAKANRGG